MIKELLALKKKIKAKNPKFRRQDYYVWSKLEDKYRKPKGMQSKQRHKRKGHLTYVQSGYRTPALVRYLTKDGLKNITVANVADLENVNAKDSAITIAKVGAKKRIDIVKAATAKKIKILNLKDDFLAKAESKFGERKSEKQKKLSEKKAKEAKKEKSAKKDEKKTAHADERSAEDKQKAEKAEKDKVLTKKQ